MGPIALFDKSFLEGLNPDEAVWFDHFFLSNVCSIFYVETQCDLAKESSNRGTPDELVRRLANKFPDFSGSPNVNHVTICTANLLGEEVPLRGQVILPQGCQVTVSGQLIAILPESPEAKAFLRWSQGRFEDEERQAAAEWRVRSTGFPPADVISMLKTMGAYRDRACETLADVRTMTEEVMNRLRPDQQCTLACSLLGIYPNQLDRILERFAEVGHPAMVSFAPYVDFALRVELFFHLAVDRSRMSIAQRMDICYLFYLPFCQLFVSNDWVHRDTTPLFLRPDQEFVSAPKLKGALRELNNRYLALSKSEPDKSIHQLAPHPPLDGDNLVTQLWDRHWPKWRQPKSNRGAVRDSRMVTADWQERLKELELIARAQAGNEEKIPSEALDAVARRRVVRKKKGSWWLVPHGLRKTKSEREPEFEFFNGATPDNVLNQEVSVYICEDGLDFASLPGCRIFSEGGRLQIDCAPPLVKQYTASVPDGAIFARSTDAHGLAVFVAPSSDLARLIKKLWEKEDARGRVGES